MALAVNKVPQTEVLTFSLLEVHSDFQLLALSDDLELNLTQGLGSEPTKKTAALHHQPPLPASKTSSVPILKLSLRARPLRPLAFLYSVDPCGFHLTPKGYFPLILQKQHNADQLARQRLELLCLPRQLQKHEQSRGFRMFREA